MSDMHAEDIQKHVRTYMIVFAALAILTAITVAVSYLHLKVFAAVTVALIIASVKGGLVAGYFMHLISEKKLIYGVLIITGIFFLAMMFLLIGSYYDQLGIFAGLFEGR